MGDVHTRHLSGVRLWILRVLVVAVLGLLATVVIYEAIRVPTWSRIGAVVAVAAGTVVGASVARRQKRLNSASIGWPAWAAAAVLGTLLAGAPDRVAVIVMAFLIALVAALLLDAERDRRRARTI
jgi:uncharacterized membrane protein YoaK (UPF0700 family)